MTSMTTDTDKLAYKLRAIEHHEDVDHISINVIRQAASALEAQQREIERLKVCDEKWSSDFDIIYDQLCECWAALGQMETPILKQEMTLDDLREENQKLKDWIDMLEQEQEV